MAHMITAFPAYTGDAPNKNDQLQPEFDTNTDTYLNYQIEDFVPAITLFITDVNTLADELETARDTSVTYAGLSQTYSTQSGVYATNANNSAVAAASSAGSTGTALVAANAILGLGIGTSYVDASGHLIFYYDDGTVALPPSINANGHLILSIEV
jgi:outer membrane receptor for ferrienterochelin and colicin